MMTWSTWEKLLLGAAVQRLGTSDWNVVASELQARTDSPLCFTPEVCKAKYEDLQQHNTAWYEEHRQKRIAELKREMEESDCKIRFIESKLESLKAEENEKRDDCHVNNGSVEPESHVPSQKMDRVDSSTEETSKEPTKQSPSTEETKLEVSNRETVYENVVYIIDEGGILRKRSGMRIVEPELHVPSQENDFSADVSFCRESPISNGAGEVVKCSDINEEIMNKNLKKEGMKDMDEILDSVLAIKGASAFSRRLDSQKGARYEKMIRKHMDFDTIRFRINSQAITSVKELLRDLLLLANNALVFYSKNTSEYKSAQLIRDHVTRTLLRGNPVPKCISSSVADARPVLDPVTEVKSLRRSTRLKLVAKAAGGNNSASGVSANRKKSDDDVDYSPPSSVKMESLPVKKAIRRPKRIVLALSAVMGMGKGRGRRTK